MTEFTSSKGIVKDIDFDFDKVCAYEESHPHWGIKDLAVGLDKGRFTDASLLASFMGFQDYRDVVEQGFTMAQLGEAVSRSKWLGFTDSTPMEE